MSYNNFLVRERDFLLREIETIVLAIERLEQQLPRCPNKTDILNNLNVLKSKKHSLQSSLKILYRNIKFPESEVYWAMHL
nr:ORF71 [Bracoviriform inaniti]